MDDLKEIDIYTYIRPSEVLSISSAEIEAALITVIHLKNGSKIYTNTASIDVYTKLRR